MAFGVVLAASQSAGIGVRRLRRIQHSRSDPLTLARIDRLFDCWLPLNSRRWPSNPDVTVLSIVNRSESWVRFGQCDRSTVSQTIDEWKSNLG